MSDNAAKIVPEFIVSDIGRSLAFYTDVLGFSVLYDRPEDRFAYLDRDGACIMIEQPTGRVLLAAELSQPYGRGMNLQIEVGDVDSLYERVCSFGSVLHLAIEDRWYRREQTLVGNRQFVVEDPDGYLLRFFSDLGTTPRERAQRD